MAHVGGAGSRVGAGGMAAGNAAVLPGLGAIARQLDAEQERWFLWLPVMFGAGIALYFLLPVEPWLSAALLPLVAMLAVHVTLARDGGVATLATGALLAATLGVAAGKVRTEAVGAPVLKRQVGPIEVYGFVELIEPRPSRGQRLTIRVAALEKHEAHAWPYRTHWHFILSHSTS